MQCIKLHCLALQISLVKARYGIYIGCYVALKSNLILIQLNPDYPDLLGLDKTVQIIEGPDYR